METEIIINGIKYRQVEEDIKPKTIWDMKKNDKFFYLDPFEGIIERAIWWDGEEFFITLRKLNLVFLSIEEAELWLLRCESRAKQVWTPEQNEEYFSYSNGNRLYWDFIGDDYMRLHNWNVHKTEQEAEEWGKKYGKAFFN